jgi:hypothetical protein
MFYYLGCLLAPKPFQPNNLQIQFHIVGLVVMMKESWWHAIIFHAQEIGFIFSVLDLFVNQKESGTVLTLVKKMNINPIYYNYNNT